MRTGGLLLIALSAASSIIMGCAGHVDGDAATASTDEASSARKPIPFVLQYVGEYVGSGHVESLVLTRTGKFTVRIDGHVHHGSFYGPSHVPGTIVPPSLVFVTTGERWSGQIDADAAWKAHDTIDVSVGGVTERLTATWSSGNESMCDETGGSWSDDDVAPATGLYCACPTGKSFIPSLGGCVR